MKIVIDTNILVSAILKDRTPEQVILFVAEHDQFEWLVSSEILAEYKAVISRPKFKLPIEIIEKWLMVFDLLTTCTDVDIKIDFPRDQKDAKFLACAIAGSATFFITGDKDFTEAQKFLDTIIISATDFNRLVIPNS
ncbi:putative nucleic acid-binding protein, contains PIN domain [Planktothrix agardhii]|jgi:putative PIN family toxin of toxin-antitoxin system|uniref:Predicted nucleic acid-binding protein, contains PIN domain n=1 Tax=Planktothrix agardhii TaxID=1160 RepID=A0A1J1JHQ3_PLAAG|nr:putative toxin-antitoxin system toxin component, PIN family [Planktothrix agardhii]MBG0746214.1 putative toxin-antitoxin system toxin component, PIN family [Planktothrix agardhii KL2]MCF3577517.1 putative toxin-antitoxin system toxin component, PIN family [Planktothrix agardhii 1812]MCF3579183.1 putative toxin-antitoxin system toxin component, PIN family [Planktothrix agardhii 1811]MCF3582380.1 putative toxin-antitoxin system toxin component, PIN family [Planktothrix agardhii 1811]MCF362331